MQWDALRAHTVVRNFPLQIAAADAWGDALVVGTADGALLVFAEAEPATPTPRGAAPPGDADDGPRYEARATLLRYRTSLPFESNPNAAVLRRGFPARRLLRR